jgi:DNA processing protein
MAYGIDGISQETTLKSGGKSYAVLGCGVDIIYPKSNGQLYNDLVLNGGIISEYPPGLEPRPQLFPPRNRIISALSDAVIVVEAKEKSGTLITVDMALEQGKDVYAVPGRCTDKLSMGCNRLLRQGALIATSAQDVIDDMGWTDIADIGKPENKGKNDVTANLSPLAGAIYNVLEITPMSQDDIITKIRAVGIDCTVPKLCQAMVELELMECALRENGQYRIKNVLKNKK